VIAEKSHSLQFLQKIKKNLSSSLSHQLTQVRTQLISYERHPFFSTSSALLAAPMQKLDDVKAKLDEKMQREILKRKYLLAGREKQAHALKPTAQLSLFQTKLVQLEKRTLSATLHILNMKKQNLKELVQRLHAVDPKNVLKRGYSILFDEKRGSVIVSAQALLPKQQVRALLSDGEVTLTVRDDTGI
jgi:exodeoxyribonuclease VII large subunit